MNLTPTEFRIKRVLDDGKEHQAIELMPCLGDELADINALHYHIFGLRNKLEAEVSQSIVTRRVAKKTTYRLVAFILTDD